MVWDAAYAEDMHVGLNQGQAYKELSCSAVVYLQVLSLHMMPS